MKAGRELDVLIDTKVMGRRDDDNRDIVFDTKRSAHTTTAPLAICLAALKAVGVEVPE